MLLVGRTLHVADIDRVRSFDLSTGKAAGEVVIDAATFLNELAVDATGTIYVTDSGLSMGADGLEPNGTDAVYRLDGGKASAVIKGPELKGPNGILAADGSVSIVTFGSNTLTTYTSAGQAGTPTALPTGGLDGLVALADGSLLISSWEGKAVYRGKPGGSFETVVSEANSPADIGFDTKRNRILIPLFLEDQVWAVPLSPPAPPAASAPETDSEGASPG
jgi:sugar lactone lactonase YvrE